MKAFVTAALLGAVVAQNTTLPQVDLGYEIYRAASFNVSVLCAQICYLLLIWLEHGQLLQL